MNASERAVTIILRVMGALAMLAVGAVVMPTSWMAACNRSLGLAELPQVPLMEYLTRSLSAMYALHGGFTWMVAGHVRRYRPLVLFSGAAMTVFGAAMLGIDLYAGLPWHWVLSEGPFIMPVGILVTVLGCKVRDAGPRPTD